VVGNWVFTTRTLFKYSCSDEVTGSGLDFRRESGDAEAHAAPASNKVPANHRSTRTHIFSPKELRPKNPNERRTRRVAEDVS
jgi:hypothetical protein